MLTKSIWMILAATVCLLLSLGTALAADGVTADMTLMDGVIDLTGIQTAWRGDRLAIPASETGVVAGSRVAFIVPNETDCMKAYRVVSVEEAGDERLLTVEALNPTAVVDSCHVTFDQVPVERSAAILPHQPEGKKGMYFNYKVGSVNMNVEMSVTNTISGSYDYEHSKDENGIVTLVSDLCIKASMTDSGGNKILNARLTDIARALTGTPKTDSKDSNKLAEIVLVDVYGMKVKGGVSLDASVSLVGNMEYHIKKYKTVQIDGPVVRQMDERLEYDRHPDFDLIGKATLGLNIDLTVALPLGSSLSLGNKCSLVLTAKEAKRYNSDIECYDLSLDLNSGFQIKASLALKYNVTDNFSVGMDFKTVTIPYGPQIHTNLLKRHLELRNPLTASGRLLDIRDDCSVKPEDRYTISFYTGTPQKIDDAYAMSGRRVTRPEDPSCASNRIRFLGWFTEAEGGEMFDFTQPLPAPDPGDTSEHFIKLWARWSQPYRKATIDLNIAGVKPTEEYILPGELIERPNVPMRMNYRFMGFTVTYPGMGSSGFGAWVFETDRMPDADVRIAAEWQKEEGYNPFEESIEEIEGNETAYAQMLHDFAFSLVPSTAIQALVTSPYDNWTILNDLIHINGYNGNASVVVIPQKLGGYPVVYVDGSGWANKESLQGLVIPSSCCYIKGFEGFTNLKYVYFRDDTMTYTGRNNFTLTFDGVIKIDDNCFKNCPSLETVHFPASVTTIGKHAFEDCSLIELDLSRSKSVTLGDYVFMNNPQLTSVKLPWSTKSLPTAAFAGCRNLKDIDLDGISSFGQACLMATGLESADLHGVVYMRNQVFSNCDEMKTLTVSFAANKSLSGCSMEHMPALESIVVDGGLITLEDAPALSDYTARNWTYDSDQVTYRTASLVMPMVGQHNGRLKLSGLPALKRVTLENMSLPGIEITDCAALSELYIQDALMPVEYNNYTNLTLTDLPALTHASIKQQTSTVRVSVKRCPFQTLDLTGCNLDSLTVAEMPNMTALTLPEPQSSDYMGRTTITDNPALQSLIIPEGSQTILSRALANNPSLTSIWLPDSLTKVGYGAFANNPSLTSVRLPENSACTYDYGIFDGCPALRVLTIPAAWPTLDLESTMFNGASVARLAVDGGTTVNKPRWSIDRSLPNLVAIETTPGTTAWTTAEATSLAVIEAGSGKRVICYKASAWQIDQFVQDHLIKTSGSLYYAAFTPGETVRLPIVVLSNSNTGFIAMLNGTAVPDNMIMPDEDIVITLEFFSSSNAGYTVTDGGARITRARADYNGVLVIPSYVSNYPVVAVDSAVLSAEGVRTVFRPPQLSIPDGSLFKDCASLEAINAAGRNYRSVDGVLYGLDAQGNPVSLLCCPQGFTGELTLPDTVADLKAWSICNVHGLTALSAPSLLRIDDDAVTGGSDVTVLSFPASLETIGANNFTEFLLKRVTFAADCAVARSAFGENGLTAFYGPVDANALDVWTEANGFDYNMYDLTLAWDGKSVTRRVRAGSSLNAFALTGEADRAFLGWTEDAAAEEAVLLTVMPAADTRVEAVFAPLFVLNGTALERIDPLAGAEIHVPYGTQAIAAGALSHACDVIWIPGTVTDIAPDSLTGAGRIVGDADSAAQAYAESAGITFEQARYTLSFESNGGSDIPAQTGCMGDAVTLPEPVRTWAVFSGWFMDAALTEPAAITAMPGRDTVLYAGWIVPPGMEMNFTCQLLPDGTAMLTGYTGTQDAPTVPEEINGAPVTAVADYAFAGNDTLTMLSFPASVVTVGKSAFNTASALASVSFAAENVTFGEDAFANCPSLRTVRLPAGLTRLSDRMFENCTGLISLSIPDTVQTIGDGAFSGCAYLSELTLPASLTALSPDALRDVPLHTVEVSPACAAFSGDGTAVWTADGCTLIFVCPDARQVSIPDTVTEIGDYALRGCSGLREIELPAGLRRIGEGAFYGCGLETLTLPDGVESIGSLAFAGKTRLDMIRIPDSVTSIGRDILGDSDPAVYVSTASGAPYRLLSGQYSVIVADDEIPVESVSFPEETITIRVGETVQLAADIEPANASDRRLTWSYQYASDAPHVLLSGNGLATGVSFGTEYMIATSANGHSARLVIDVIEADEPPQIILDWNNVIDGVYYVYYGAYLSLSSNDYSLPDTAQITASEPVLEESDTWQSLQFKSLYDLPDAIDGLPVRVTITIPRDEGDPVVGTFDFMLCLDNEQLSSFHLPSQLTLYTGDVYHLEGYSADMLDNVLARAKGFRLATSDADVASVDADGYIHANAEGRADILITGRVAYADPGICQVRVLPSQIDMTASLDCDFLCVNQSGKISAAVSGDAQIEYTSEKPAIASVDENGVVTALKSGTAVIRVSAVKDGVTLTARTVSVNCINGVTRLNLKNCFDTQWCDSAWLPIAEIGETVNLMKHAWSNAYYDAPNPRTVRWATSDSSVLSIDENGIAHILAPGRATVTGCMLQNGQEESLEVVCDDWSAALVMLTPDSVCLSVGDTLPLQISVPGGSAWLHAEYTVYDSDGDETPDSDVIRVDEQGIITALGSGDARVIVSMFNTNGYMVCSNSETPIAVHVWKDGDVHGFVGIPDRVTLNVGETLTVVSTENFIPADATLANWDVFFLEDSTVASRVWRPNGVAAIYGVKPGETVLTLKAPSLEPLQIAVTVTKPAVYGEIANIPSCMTPGESVLLQGKELTPAGGCAVTWSSSNPSVLSVTGDGRLTAVAEGSARITMTVSAGGGLYKATANVSVDKPLHGFTVPADPYLKKADDYWSAYYLPLTPAVPAEAGIALAEKTTVTSANGLYYSVNYGMPTDDAEESICYLQFSSNSFERKDTVTLSTENGTQRIDVTFEIYADNGDDSLYLDDCPTIGVGQRYDLDQLVSTALPVRWSAEDTGVVSIDGHMLTGLCAGSVQVTATAVGEDGRTITADQTITVDETSASIEYDGETTLSALENQWIYINLKVDPEDAPAWIEVSDPGVAQVARSNRYSWSDSWAIAMIALSAGSTDVTLRGVDGELLTLTLNVSAAPTSIRTNLDGGIHMILGETFQAVAELLPKQDYACDIAWSVDYGGDSILSVDKNGLITALGEGTTSVQVSAGTLRRYFHVTVYQPLRDLRITPDEARLPLGERMTLQAVDGSGSTIPDYMLVWTSSNPGCVAVSADGAVQAICQGNAVVTASARDGDASATARITVSGAFSKLILPAMLTEIGEEAFAGDTGFDAVEIGARVTRIGANAFADCASLRRVVILNPDCAVDATAFARCADTLEIFCVPGSAAWSACESAGWTVTAAQQ